MSFALADSGGGGGTVKERTPNHGHKQIPKSLRTCSQFAYPRTRISFKSPFMSCFHQRRTNPRPSYNRVRIILAHSEEKVLLKEMNIGVDRGGSGRVLFQEADSFKIDGYQRNEFLLSRHQKDGHHFHGNCCS
jgi:hypothetical protein